MDLRAEDVVVARGPDFKSAHAVTHSLAFRREYVRSYIESSSGAPLVLVQAPPGYGKTTVLSFFGEAEGGSSRWVRLDEADRALATFVGSLASAIYGWPVTPPSAMPDVREAAKWIVSAIEELAVTTILLDDYEAVADCDDANALVEAIAEKLPPYIRLVVGSGQTPGFRTRARLRQMVVELDMSDLRFDADDVARYLREVHNYEISDTAATSVARRSGGCAATVNLVGQLCHDLPRYLRVDFEALPLGATVQHLTTLLREVLARGGQPPARAARALLDADVADPDGPTPADTVLDFLAQRNCLVEIRDTDPRVVVPHALLRAIAAGL
jgi:hypothetical protein